MNTKIVNWELIQINKDIKAVLDIYDAYPFSVRGLDETLRGLYQRRLASIRKFKAIHGN